VRSVLIGILREQILLPRSSARCGSIRSAKNAVAGDIDLDAETIAEIEALSA
jgi:hypothetical protein